MEAIWVAAITAGGAIGGALLTLLGQWLLARGSSSDKLLESNNAVVIAQIGAESNERIELARTLTAHNEALQKHNLEQDRLVIDLTSAKAGLHAAVKVLEAEKIADDMKLRRLERDLETANGKVEYLTDELESVRQALQSEVTDALEYLETHSEPVDD